MGCIKKLAKQPVIMKLTPNVTDITEIAKAAEAFLTDQQYAVKGNAAVHIDELIQVARFREYKEDVDGKHKNDVGEDGFNYFDAYFMNADGQYYLIPLSAGINENDETAYSVGNPKRRRFPNRAGSSSKTEALKNGGKPSVNNDSTNQPNRQEVKTAIQIAYGKAVQEKKRMSWFVFPASFVVALLIMMIPGRSDRAVIHSDRRHSSESAASRAFSAAR